MISVNDLPFLFSSCSVRTLSLHTRHKTFSKNSETVKWALCDADDHPVPDINYFPFSPPVRQQPQQSTCQRFSQLHASTSKKKLLLSLSLSLSHICSLSPTEAALSPHTWHQAANTLKVISNMSIRTPTRFLFSRAGKKNINTPFWGRNGLSQHSGAALRNDVPPIFFPLRSS